LADCAAERDLYREHLATLVDAADTVIRGEEDKVPIDDWLRLGASSKAARGILTM
jgi:hypothetical protein